MSKLRQRHLRSSHADARLVLGAILGELMGALVGLMLAPKPHWGVTVEVTNPSYVNASDPSDTDDSEPLVVWPLLGAVAGVVIGVGAARVYEEVRRVWRVDGRRQTRSAVTHR